MTLTRREFGALGFALGLGGLMPGWARATGSGEALAMGLAPVRDWSTQQPFLDVFKTARRWIGHRPGQWGGLEFGTLDALGMLDADGWPLRIPSDLGSIGTLILTDMPEESVLAGRYVLRFDGSGIVEVAGRAQNKRYGEGEVRFDYTPGPGPVEIRIQRSDRRGTGDHVRNIRVAREEDWPALEAGALFRPGWLEMLRGCSSVRFMDWMNTNGSEQGNWDIRPKPGDFSYSRHGVPVEVMVALTHELGCDGWFNIPHLADDTYVRSMAEAVKAQMAPGSRAYVEYSNELWNWQFLQTEWADARGLERWGEQHRVAQFHGMRAAEVARLWSDVFSGADRARLVNVIATQTGWLGLERDILGAPLYVAENPGSNRPPHEAFDAYAVTGYFGHMLGTEAYVDVLHGWLEESRAAAQAEGAARGLSGQALDDHIAAHRFDLAVQRAVQELRDGSVTGMEGDTLGDLLGRVLPYHAGVAEAHGLDLIMYEGGSHVAGVGAQANDEALTEFFIHLNYTAEMGALYEELLQGWAALTPGAFNHYSDMQAPSKWGSWGALRYPGDANPRWDALARWR